MKHVEIDFETRSPVDLKKCGPYVYFDHPEARVLLGSYQIDGGAVRRWREGDPMPGDLRQAVEEGATISAHNAAFEMLCFEWLAKNAGWIMPRFEQFRCTAATAAAMSLPRDLKTLGEVLDLDVQKDKEGFRLMRMFSIPKVVRKARTFEIECLTCMGAGVLDTDPDHAHLCDDCGGRGKVWIFEPEQKQFVEPEDDPEAFEAYHAYCDTDVLTEAAADALLVPLSADEQDVWQLSERINRRGIRIDVRSARAAIRLADKAVADLNVEMAELTGGAVRKVSEVSKLVTWAKEQGVDLTGAAKNDIDEALQMVDLPAKVRKALELRQEGAKTSVKKIEAMLDRASADGRVRGTFMYHGAGTGRWTSMGVNFANMPRPRRIYEDAHLNTQTLFRAFRTEDPAVLKTLYGDDLGRPLHLISDAVRGFVWAAPGLELVQADYSGIEGAVIAWLADETWKLQAMFEIIADHKNKPDMYRQTAARILNLTTDIVDKKHWARQAVGKVSELACFGPETRVITSNGVKVLRNVNRDDLLWDGVEWVKHQGVIAKGVRRVVNVDGIDITPDHMVLVQGSWKKAGELVSDANILSRALATGSDALSSLAVEKGLTADWRQCRSSAIAVTNTKRRSTSWLRAALPSAASAPGPLPHIRGSLTSVMRVSSLMTSIAGACSTAFHRVTAAASTLTTRASGTTAGGEYPCSGDVIVEHSWLTWSRLKGGITRLLTSIESTSTAITRREISASLHAARTALTSAKCKTKKQKSPRYENVFDILNAGPRNRFTIFSDSGALVVHNCGFQGGVSAFASMAAIYNVDLDALYGPTWENASEEERTKAEKRHASVSKRKKEASDRMSRQAWLACEIIKRGWREQNSAISQSWHDAEAAVREAVEYPGTVTQAIKCKFVVRLGYLWMQLPSGRCLAYASPRLASQVWACVRLDDGQWSDPEVMEREEAEKLSEKGHCKIEGDTSPGIRFLGVDGTTKKWRRSALYGGLIVQNATQATARDILVNGMRKAEAAGYPVISHVYDEIITEVPRGFGDLKEFERLICELPAWAEGLPLTAGGWRGKRYRKD